MNKFNSPLTKFSFQSPINTENFPWGISYEEIHPCRISNLTELLPISILYLMKQVQVVVTTTIQLKQICPVVVERETQLLAHKTILE